MSHIAGLVVNRITNEIIRIFLWAGRWICYDDSSADAQTESLNEWRLLKRDLENANIPLMTIDQMQTDLNRQLKVPSFPGAAMQGVGVGETLKTCRKLVLKSLKYELNL